MYIDAQSGSLLYNSLTGDNTPTVTQDEAIAIAQQFTGDGRVYSVRQTVYKDQIVYEIRFANNDRARVNAHGQVVYVWFDWTVEPSQNQPVANSSNSSSNPPPEHHDDERTRLSILANFEKVIMQNANTKNVVSSVKLFLVSGALTSTVWLWSMFANKSIEDLAKKNLALAKANTQPPPTNVPVVVQPAAQPDPRNYLELRQPRLQGYDP